MESAAHSHADNRAVQSFFENRLIEWGAGIRSAVTQVAATKYKNSLTSLLVQGAGSDDRTDGRRKGKDVPLAIKWMLRHQQGRHTM